MSAATFADFAPLTNIHGMSPADMPRPPDLDRRFAPFAAKMAAAGLGDVVIRTFCHHYAQLLDGATGYIPGAVAGPVDHVPDVADTAGYRAAGAAALDRAVVIKLNGGLGTSMGLSGPKSLLPVKDGLTFLDIIARQVLALRVRTGARVPLVLMNSFNTREATLAALAAYPELSAGDLPLDFLQHKVPKVRRADLAPAVWPADPDREWCPPGHGDIYPALVASGMLDRMLGAGYEVAFVSNADNLGAMLDVGVLGYIAVEHVPFLMEVADRTPADRKGGHLARRPDGGLILRESAQCPPEEAEAFQDIGRYRYFNTNNLWVHLPSLKAVLDRGGGVIDLPLIRNVKPVEPGRPDSDPVYQLETAMGSAIAVFDGARALRVGGDRFRPVKKTGDLLGLWSDAYRTDADWRLALHPDRHGRIPLVDLDDRYFGLLGDLEARFPNGAPSLLRCDRLRVRGDVCFGRDVVCEGDVEIVNPGDVPMVIEDGRVIRGASPAGASSE